MSEAVGCEQVDLRPGHKILKRTHGQNLINLYGCDVPFWTDQLGEDGAVVSSAGADMDHALAGSEFEVVVEAGPKAGLPIVKSAPFVDGDEHIMIQMMRVSVVGRPICNGECSHGAT